MVRNWLPPYANWAILRKEICDVGSVHGKQVAEQKNPFVISPVRPHTNNDGLPPCLHEEKWKQVIPVS
ncbi:hypothetical protein GFM86_26305 [Escherichia coli]|nr:hypothetical protein [Escherichia coli]